MVVRIFDAISAPTFGMVVDRVIRFRRIFMEKLLYKLGEWVYRKPKKVIAT